MIQRQFENVNRWTQFDYMHDIIASADFISIQFEIKILEIRWIRSPL